MSVKKLRTHCEHTKQVRLETAMPLGLKSNQVHHCRVYKLDFCPFFFFTQPAPGALRSAYYSGIEIEKMKYHKLFYNFHYGDIFTRLIQNSLTNVTTTSTGPDKF